MKEVTVIFLAGVLALGQCADYIITENVALRGRASQSSTYNYLTDARSAIDGDRKATYASGSCTQTELQVDPWWRVDLLYNFNVASVTITNREDCCPERLDGAEIRIGKSMENNGNNNPVCAVVSTIPAGESVTFECHDMVGRYVNIIRPGCYKFLTLCEVEVKPGISSEDTEMEHGGDTDASPCSVKVPDNAASGGKATQSSTIYGGGAEKAIDKNHNSIFEAGSCTSTKVETDPWWRVDLLKKHRVTSVTITNIEDCCPERLDGAEIRIGNSMENNGNNNPVCAVVSTIPAGESVTFQCQEMEGRYVNIIRPGCFKFLTLCEVEVNASAVSEHIVMDPVMDPVTNEGDRFRASQCSEIAPDNAASGGRATQSSTAFAGYAGNAIDGNRNPYYKDGSCTSTKTETDPWWRVDLFKKHRVTSVTITNRGDCCPHRLDGAEIRIGNSMENNGNNNPVCAVVSTIPAGESVTFECHEMEGRYVNIIRPGCYKFLTLCEVEVNASAVSDDALSAQTPLFSWIEEFMFQLMDRVTIQGNRLKASQCSAVAPDNAASGGRATQSSTLYAGTANHAINKLYPSCTSTTVEANPWWRVDLYKKHRVTSVTITNRVDYGSERLDGAEIRIGNSMENKGNNNPVCAVVSTIPAGESVTFQCHEMEGRYVNIILPGCYKLLTLCEVEVNAIVASETKEGDRFNASQCSVVAPVNAASRGKATQSSTDYGGSAHRAIDGFRIPVFASDSCTHTRGGTDPWWRVDLLRKHRVTSVTITNRGDCCAERIIGAEIRIGNSMENNGNNNPVCAVISQEEDESFSFTFQCHEMEGRYVNVFLPGRGRYLSMCEVEVYGSAVPDDFVDSGVTTSKPPDHVNQTIATLSD